MRVELSATCRFAVVLAVAVAAVTIDNVRVLELMALATFLLFVASARSLRRVCNGIAIAMLTAWCVMVSQAMFYQGYPRTIIAVLIPKEFPVLGWLTGGVYLYYEGFLWGLRQSLRFLTTLFAGLAMAFLGTQRGVLSSVRTSRSPELMLSLAIAIRSLARVGEDAKEVSLVARLRGYRLGNPLKLFKTLEKLYTPLIAMSMRRAYSLAVAAETRAFSITRSATRHAVTRRSKLEYIVLAGSLLIMSLLIMLRLVYFLCTIGVLDWYSLPECVRVLSKLLFEY